MNWNPSDRDCVSATKDAVACEFGEGLALLNLKSNIYYSLNGVGAFIWDLIQEPKPVADIRSAVLARYNVDAERCKGDVDALLKGLAENGLARLEHEAVV
ncbi:MULTISPECIES: PqqD family protein [unclassified Mesorhizobium]|uniref:PqqD family protein n=1 Tax=unclassified Mesorhizobium TaxID=325217 RepID=UPI000FCB857C|nr:MULTISPECIES: PqqD family protein [unclassified Mesorhizobium]RUW99511.1 PqqD family protein [Mesorhizobium sp. M8A.F.Ca.ET.023.01.1.1]RUX08714.1 PqqD family protein [Mesorhizobium sp. M8A.F.Ca.ET.059.01.1.1]RVD45063.1 PqqD family protein [Mesorhizobium sp. M8A.F.Ca.ET.023.02.2.1]TGR38055.1 PqqD family protein [bacterium M00.F.Ca.ET.199.01.1.1]TGU26350.1 PqqD family protein [bacterium M00.F.Ca.ET.156.01.1.1]TGU99218.1 PqqD family protein [Mesorhizobium sp. M00.F.Ca.ET.151.01.1.1]TGV09562.